MNLMGVLSGSKFLWLLNYPNLIGVILQILAAFLRWALSFEDGTIEV